MLEIMIKMSDTKHFQSKVLIMKMNIGYMHFSWKIGFNLPNQNIVSENIIGYLNLKCMHFQDKVYTL